MLYEPVHQWQTRLLCVDHTSLEGDLTARLVKVDLTFLKGAALHDEERLVEYQALSYAWGVPNFTRFIKVNGEEFGITQNLFRFLCEYRRKLTNETRDSWLWIDQICINQSDPVEKAMQVSNMLTIYQKADRAIIWLGQGDLCTRDAASFLSEDSNTGTVTSAIRQGLRDLYRRAWFERIWVRQEVWASSSLEVWCGSDTLGWNELIQPFTSPYEVTKKEPYSRGPFWINTLGLSEALWNAHHALRSFSSSPASTSKHHNNIESRPNILELVMGSTFCKCADERDRVYALLGMSRDMELKIDYSISLPVLFRRVARYLMIQYNHNLLALEATFGASPELPIPSWVPDFRKEMRGTLYSDDIMSKEIMRIQRPVTTEAGEDTLTLWGMIVGYLCEAYDEEKSRLSILQGSELPLYVRHTTIININWPDSVCDSTLERAEAHDIVTICEGCSEMLLFRPQSPDEDVCSFVGPLAYAGGYNDGHTAWQREKQQANLLFKERRTQSWPSFRKFHIV